MEFSKNNIISKHFSKRFVGGLDEFEVRDFLLALAEEIRHLTQKNSLQKNKIQEQEMLIQDFRDREHILKKSIASAEKWAEKIRKDAEDNSTLVLEKAHGKSESLIQEARHSLQTVYNDIADLKRLQMQFKSGLKAALQVQMDLLNQEPIFDPASILSTSSTQASLKNKQAPKQQALSSKKEVPSLMSLEQKENSSKIPTIDDQDLASLKESLSSLDKSFS